MQNNNEVVMSKRNYRKLLMTVCIFNYIWHVCICTYVKYTCIIYRYS